MQLLLLLLVLLLVVLLLEQVDMEYLKNLVLQLYTTGEAEALLPVFSTLLTFSKEERFKAQQVPELWATCSSA